MKRKVKIVTDYNVTKHWGTYWYIEEYIDVQGKWSQSKKIVNAIPGKNQYSSDTWEVCLFTNKEFFGIK